MTDLPAEGFAPIEGADSKLLILGSLPGRASLRAFEYYAHPRNAFWPIMRALTGAEGSYEQRCDTLKAHGIAVWDVLRESVRPGSLDASIVTETAIPNDFEGLFARQPGISLICFNGRKAEQLFYRSFAPRDGLPASSCLPSTSPAHASMSFEEKLASWRRVLEPLLR